MMRTACSTMRRVRRPPNSTLQEWPKESPSSCVLPEQPVAQPLDAVVAERHCAPISDRNTRANCVFDVRVTGHAGFAQTYLLAQRLQPGATEIVVKDDKDPTSVGENVTFTATVSQAAPRKPGALAGKAQFVLDGDPTGAPVALDASGKSDLDDIELDGRRSFGVGQLHPRRRKRCAGEQQRSRSRTLSIAPSDGGCGSSSCSQY